MPNDAQHAPQTRRTRRVSVHLVHGHAKRRKPNLRVVATRDKELAVWAPFDGVDAAQVPVQCLHTLQTRHPTRQRGDLSLGE